MNANQQPAIRWSKGTAYDLFASLHVLHHPERFGLRLSWAAGVRSRLTPSQRTILEDAQSAFISSPVAWIASLPEARDAGAALSALKKMELKDVLPFLAYHSDLPLETMQMLNGVYSAGSWSKVELDQLQAYFLRKQSTASSEKLVTVLKWWASPAEFGGRFLDAIQAYIEVFFAEEEKRIEPYLQQALDIAQEKAVRLNFTQLMVELSQGVSITAFEAADEATFVPSYWITPLVMYDTVLPNKWVILFGARPAEVSLVPGEVIPDAMLRALKALAEPTRLLILHYLSEQPATPSQLARKLRLRAPTVVHHLSALRLAGLVNISMDNEEEKRYAVRSAAVGETFEILSRFLSEGS